MGATVFVARSQEEVEELRSEWIASDNSNIDADIDYFLTVVKYSPEVIRPHVVVIRRDDRPTLIAVARLERIKTPITIGYKTFLRPPVMALVLAFGGILGAVEPADERLLIAELRRPLSEGEAEMLLLRKIDVSGTLRNAAIEGVGWLRRSHGQAATGRWVATVPKSLEELLASRSKKTRAKRRREDSKIEREYGDKLKVRRFQRSAELPELLGDLESIASKTYQRGLGAAYSGSELDRALIQAGLDRGWFRAWVLYLSNTPIAFWYGTTYAGTFSTGTPGFDREYAKESVGRYTMYRMFEDLCQDPDVVRVDFGHGDAAYKEALGSRDRFEADVYVTARRARPIAISLFATALVVLNKFARMVARDTNVGRRLKRAWRAKIAGRSLDSQARSG